MMDPIMILMDPSLRGSPDFDTEADYPSLSEQIECYYDAFDDYMKEKQANEPLRKY